MEGILSRAGIGRVEGLQISQNPGSLEQGGGSLLK
jgi:hypothetical protein